MGNFLPFFGGLILVFLSSAYCKQRVVVNGALKCDGKPYSGATVKLYDTDVIVDTNMARNTSGKDGRFILDGTARDVVTNIDPTLYIYHKCEKGLLSCKRELIFGISSIYVFDDKAKNIRPLQVEIELTLKPKKEESKCLPAKKA